jgi:predicted NUDIX family phosphoesterase
VETILVIRRDALFGGEWPQGFRPAASPEAAAALAAVTASGFLVDRGAAEQEPEWKQPIPYCLLIRPGEVFCVERLPAQGEGRLHGRLSLGIGGHVGPQDTGRSGDPVLAALRRELAEEVRLEGTLPPPGFVGLVNDDAEAVGRVHFGLVFSQWLPREASVEIVESSKMAGDFRLLAGPQGLWQDLPRFESWSRILLRARAVEALATGHATTARSQSCGKTQEEPRHG